MKKKVLIIGIIVSCLLAWIVIAASAGDGIKVVSPVGGTRIQWLNGTTIFNATFLNGTDVGSNVEIPKFNASFMVNISGVLLQIANITNGCVQIASTSDFSCVSLNATNLTVSEGNYTLYFNVSNGTASAITNVSANMSQSFVIDHTAPIVFASNISNPIGGNNYSTSILINTSAIDSVLGVSIVLFNITNSSDIQNATIIASQEGSSSRYVVSINTSHYPDGYYNLTIYANDSLGNLNNTARVSRVIFDNTAPTITHSCDDYVVGKDDVITCTCSTTDSLSGVNTSYGTNGRIFTASPSTSNSGNNQQTACSSQDKAGNIRISTLYYNVTSATSSSSSTTSSSSSSTSSGTNSSSNTTSSTTNQRASNDTNNTLQGNQGNSGTPDIKSINLWIVGGIVLLIIVSAIIYFLIKKFKTKKFK